MASFDSNEIFLDSKFCLRKSELVDGARYVCMYVKFSITKLKFKNDYLIKKEKI